MKPLNRGTFAVLVVIAFLWCLSALMVIGAIIVITVRGGTPPAILGALAMLRLTELLTLGDKVFVWTRELSDADLDRARHGERVRNAGEARRGRDGE